MRHGVPQPRQDRLPRRTTLIRLQLSRSDIIEAAKMAKHLDTHGGPRYSGAVFGLFYREDIYNRKVLSFNQQGGV